jgi:hypothetical protein
MNMTKLDQLVNLQNEKVDELVSGAICRNSLGVSDGAATVNGIKMLIADIGGVPS